MRNAEQQREQAEDTDRLRRAFAVSAAAHLALLLLCGMRLAAGGPPADAGDITEGQPSSRIDLTLLAVSPHAPAAQRVAARSVAPPRSPSQSPTKASLVKAPTVETAQPLRRAPVAVAYSQAPPVIAVRKPEPRSAAPTALSSHPALRIAAAAAKPIASVPDVVLTEGEAPPLPAPALTPGSEQKGTGTSPEGEFSTAAGPVAEPAAAAPAPSGSGGTAPSPNPSTGPAKGSGGEGSGDRAAEPLRRAIPDFPPGLTEPGVRLAVRVEVTIAADGIAIPRLAQSSGDPDVDRCVLAALRRWTWRPAIKGGAAVSSVETFRYDFEVN